MKILWLCNTIIKEIAEEVGMPVYSSESWIKPIYERMIHDGRIKLLCALDTSNWEEPFGAEVGVVDN